MRFFVSVEQVRFGFNRFRERLWVRPLIVCLLSIAAVFGAKAVEDSTLLHFVPAIATSSVEALLSVMASSMLVIATFLLGSMVSAYASASQTATPRSFALMVADDVTQNALSSFVGAFIFSVVALTAVKNEYFASAGLFILFTLTVLVFAIVIAMFVRSVDSIARLGRLGSTIEKVERAAENAFRQRKKWPALGGIPARKVSEAGHAVHSGRIGYIQQINMAPIQQWADEMDVQVMVAALPGSFVSPDRVLAYITSSKEDLSDIDCSCLIDSFQTGESRVFECDPRFGLVVLAEIAGRALSPAVNDPGTAIRVLGSFSRLFAIWNTAGDEARAEPPVFDRITVPCLSTRDMFDDAFTPIARDGAGTLEVAVRLQKTLKSLAALGNVEIKDAAIYHRELALARSHKALEMEQDLAVVQAAAGDRPAARDNPVSSDNGAI